MWHRSSNSQAPSPGEIPRSELRKRLAGGPPEGGSVVSAVPRVTHTSRLWKLRIRASLERGVCCWVFFCGASRNARSLLSLGRLLGFLFRPFLRGLFGALLCAFGRGLLRPLGRTFLRPLGQAFLRGRFFTLFLLLFNHLHFARRRRSFRRLRRFLLLVARGGHGDDRHLFVPDDFHALGRFDFAKMNRLANVEVA